MFIWEFSIRYAWEWEREMTDLYAGKYDRKVMKMVCPMVPLSPLDSVLWAVNQLETFHSWERHCESSVNHVKLQ